MKPQKQTVKLSSDANISLYEKKYLVCKALQQRLAYHDVSLQKYRNIDLKRATYPSEVLPPFLFMLNSLLSVISALSITKKLHSTSDFSFKISDPYIHEINTELA